MNDDRKPTLRESVDAFGDLAGEIERATAPVTNVIRRGQRLVFALCVMGLVALVATVLGVVFLVR